MTGSLTGCRALVVDVSDGTGAAVVRRLAAEGARVAFSGADAGRSARLVQRVRGFGREVEHLTGPRTPEDLLEDAVVSLGGLDVVVLAADVGTGGTALSAVVRSAATRAGSTGVTIMAAQVDEGARAAGAGTTVRLLSFADIRLDGISVTEGRAAAAAMVAAGWTPPSWWIREERSA